jgi:broad specificity phosphatase PhoE
MSLPSKHFYIIRHGETEANAAKCMSGQVDTPLTHLGISQAQKTAAIMGGLDPKPNIILHSHLSRARDTAAYLNEALGLQMIEDAAWAEQHFGDWQGTPYHETQNLVRAGNPPPNGETREIFYERVLNAALLALDKYELPLIVCHGGVIRGIAAALGRKIQGVHNCVLYEFKPAESSSRANFAWNVYEYDAENGMKNLLSLFHDERMEQYG